MTTLIYQTNTDSYVSTTHLLERESYGSGKWIYVDKTTGKVIDRDTFRHDLAERNKLQLIYTGKLTA